MPPRLAATLDHVAVAVADPAEAAIRWVDQLGAVPLAGTDSGVFATRQLRFTGGGKLELISPSPDDPTPTNFVRRFIARHGTRIHHLTLAVPDIDEAVATAREAGLDVVDISTGDPHWKEAFLRPGQVGGVVVQLAWASQTDDEWVAALGRPPAVPAPDGPRLLGPVLRHTDLDRAQALWRLLGADVEVGRGRLTARWTDCPMDVVVLEHEVSEPGGLRMAGTAALPAADGIGPAVIG